MNNPEPSWVHDPEPETEKLQFSFDFHNQDDSIIWLPVDATVTINGSGVDIECNYTLPNRFYWDFYEYIDSQILEDQLHDHFSEIYTEFDVEFTRI